MGQYQTFVVRLWADVEESSLRGHVQHVASRRGVYFRDVERMLHFINEYLEPVTLPAAADGADQAPDRESQVPTPDGGEADDR